MSAGTVLAAIDEALDAHGTISREGTDAMRWSPERVICDGGRPLMPAAMRVTAVSYAPFTEFGRRPACRCSLLPFLSEERTGAIAESSAGLQRSFTAMAGALDVLQRMVDAMHAGQSPRRCRACNPRGYCEPLAINGREYHRRQRARERRR